MNRSQILGLECSVLLFSRGFQNRQGRVPGNSAEKVQIVAVRKARFTGSEKHLEISTEEGWRSQTS